jgi:hypothetical protein
MLASRRHGRLGHRARAMSKSVYCRRVRKRKRQVAETPEMLIDLCKSHRSMFWARIAVAHVLGTVAEDDPFAQNALSAVLHLLLAGTVPAEIVMECSTRRPSEDVVWCTLQG